MNLTTMNGASLVRTSHAPFPGVDDRRILNGHLLALAFSPTMARSARKLAFPLRLATIASFVAAGWRLGPDHGSVGCFS